MSRYFIDTEFLEGKQDKRFLGFKYGETKPTIDLISIALVSEDNREYYAISKDFNLYEAWNRYDIKRVMNSGDMRNHVGDYSDIKVYWIRDNVLKPIWNEFSKRYVVDMIMMDSWDEPFTYSNLKYLINKYGKTNEQIAKEVKRFVGTQNINGEWFKGCESYTGFHQTAQPEFYGYYADYDWVAFCWLFGNMIDLPKGFPMYCIDLKQELDKWDLKNKIKQLPKQINEHNALADARWNKELYNFLKQL